MHTILRGQTREVRIGIDRPFVIIGEKINPTGHKKLATALQNQDYEYVRTLVDRQISWGADVLDINVGVPGLDEVGVMPMIVKLVTSISDIPLCLDSGNPIVLAAGLNAAPGKPLVNSVSGEQKRLESILPVVKDRGAAVIGLTMDDNGIPATAEERTAVAERIINCATKIGIPIEDVIIDPLVLTVGSNSKAAFVTLQTILMVQKEFGVNINLGASNVSFGLPDRLVINQAFLSLAIQVGATCSITDPAKLGSTIKATDLLLAKDENSLRYLKYFRAVEKLRIKEAEQKS